MDPDLYNAVITGNIAFLRQLANSDLTVFGRETTQKDNILHVAAKYDRNQIAEDIIKLPQLMILMNQKNSKGDTPLHIAARLGSLKTAQILITYAKNMSQEIEAGNERFIRMVNMKKDNALHDAARNGHLQITKLLIREDPELILSTNENGESPLFIAVDKKNFDLARHMLDVAPVFSSECRNNVIALRAAVAGRNNMNVLHAAVIRSRDEVVGLLFYLRDPWALMKFLIDKPFREFVEALSCTGPSIINRVIFSNSSHKTEEFIEYLMERCPSVLSETDEYEWTPLHYAVQFGEVDIVKLFLSSIDSSTTCINRDKEGMSLVHIAAREGEVTILEKLVDRFPEIWDLQDNKGQTTLHLAVAKRKLNSVKFILGNALSHDGLINQQDNEGNTALHLTAIQGDYGKIFKLLIKDKRVDKTATNKEGLTVIDIILLEKPVFFKKIWTAISVASNGGIRSLEHETNKNFEKTRPIKTRKLEQPQQSERRESASDTQVEGQRQLEMTKVDPAGLKEANYDQIKHIASTNLLVTTLIATVSFAAAFTIPGGYKSDGPSEGKAVLSMEVTKIFVIANTFAFAFSITSMFFHYWNSLEEKLDDLLFYTYITSILTKFGTWAMAIAFLSGTYATLADSPGLAIAVLSIITSFYGIGFLIYMKSISELCNINLFV